MNEEKLHEEESSFKVADKRKFNVDGSLRDGVVIEESKPKPEEKIAAPATQETTQVETAPQLNDNAQAVDEDDEPLDEAKIPGADNPSSFANFLMTLVAQAAAAMGLSENPVSGQRRVDLEASKFWIDVLGMLKEKTSGNLHPQEQKLIDGLLGDLRMQFVAVTRAAEQQTMQRAAQKITGKDIFGK